MTMKLQHIMKVKFLFLLLLLQDPANAQKATISEESRNILTYAFSDPDPIPILTKRNYFIYPYFSFDGYSTTGKNKRWRVIKLENDFIEVYVLPEVGGKVWGAIEKSTGKEFVYWNKVLKFRNISLRGPWTSGGIEFNFGIIGHSPSTATPVDYLTRQNEDGSISCFVSNLDLPSRTKWTVEIRVPKDRAYFETRTMWSNPTPLPQSYYNWMTAAAAVSDDLEFAYPGNQEIGHAGEHGLWPVNKDGRNVALYKENNFGSSKSYHVVGEYNDFMGGYYHKSDFGFGHWAMYDEMPGRKLWLWSLARDGEIWKDLLTDSDGQYMEFQAGRLFNQYAGSTNKTPISQVPFAPCSIDQWNEIWFPVKEIGGLTDVSPMGILNVTHEDGKLNIGINALAVAGAKISVRSDGKVIYSEEKKFKPMEVFQTSLNLDNNAGYEVVVEGMDLRYNNTKNLIKRPFVSKMPVSLSTAASMYQEAMQLKEKRNYRSAKELFKKCLEKDPLYIDAMAAMSELYYRSVQYDSALYYSNNALQLDTYHPAANYFAGLIYTAMGDFTNALESFGWAARSTEFRSSSYYQMAAIQLRQGNKQLTGHYADEALDFDRHNIGAMEVLEILYRKSGESAMADKYLESISNLDPLNHFADFERNLVHPSSENYQHFTSSITNEMPYQTYIELCLFYYNLGLKDDALLVLDKAPAQPLITLWKAYLRDDPSMLDEVTNEPAAFVFPYRTETVSALKWALSKNNNWKFKYYLALNYLAIQRDADAMDLFRSCGQEPDYSPFYLTRSSVIRSEDYKSELTDLLTAQKLSPEDWRTMTRLIDYYEAQHDNAKALTASKAAYFKHKDNSSLGIKYAISLINNGQYANSIKVLEGLYILPFEGASQGKVVFEQACLFLAMEEIKNKHYNEAIKLVNKSEEWPENLGVGKPYIVDNRIQDYMKIFCLEKLHRTGETEVLKTSIIEYTKDHITSPSYNNVLAIWLLREKGESEEANGLISKISLSLQPDDLVQHWVIAASNDDRGRVDELEKNFSDNTSFKILKKLTEIMNK